MNPIDAYKGATKTLHCTKLDDTGTPVSLVGATIQARLYRSREPDNTIADLKVVVQELGPANIGEYTITLTAIESAALSRGPYMCQIRYIYGATTDILDPFEWRIL